MDSHGRSCMSNTLPIDADTHVLHNLWSRQNDPPFRILNYVFDESLFVGKVPKCAESRQFEGVQHGRLAEVGDQRILKRFDLTTLENIQHWRGPATDSS